MFFCLGSSRVALLGLNNLFLVFLFAGFICLIFYLFIDEAAVFQLFYFIILLVENLWFDYIISFLYSVALFRSFAFLFGFFLSVVPRLCINQYLKLFSFLDLFFAVPVIYIYFFIFSKHLCIIFFALGPFPFAQGFYFY